MKKIVTVAGILFLAELLFVGLVYGLLAARGRLNPETLGRLHDLPVVGGFFGRGGKTNPKAPTPEELRDARIRRAIDETEDALRLPPPYTREEVDRLVTELRAARLSAEQKAKELERLELERGTLEAEIAARREVLDTDLETLDRRLKEFRALREEIAKERSSLSEALRSDELKNFKLIAGIYEKMGAESAAAQLAELDDDACARVIAAMEPRIAGKVLGAFETLKAVSVTRRLQKFRAGPESPEEND